MTLLNDNPLPSPIVIPKEVRLQNTTRRIKELSKSCYNNLVKIQRDGIDMVWNNEHITPQEIIDELGSDALKIFNFHGKLSQFILEVAQSDGSTVELKYPTKAYTVNLSSGSITVSDQPYQP